MNKTVLAIGAHPDDMEQFAGGTLILLKQSGYEIVICPLTKGECGSRELSAEEIVKIRNEESVNAAKIIGARYLNIGLRDGSIPYDLDTVKKVVGVIREVNPSIIFTHPTVDYIVDHSHTGQLVLWAVPEALHKNFIIDSPVTPLSHHPFVYHTDPQGLTFMDGQIARVNTIVDISDVIDKKMAAFAQHKSQIHFLVKKSGQIDTIEKTKRWAITRGEQVRIAYGEGFQQQLFAEYPRENIVKKILEEKVFTI